VIHAAVRDLLYRRRRYLISTLGAGLVFAMSLIMTGLSDAFPAEWGRTVDALGAESFVIPAELSGPFTGASPFDADLLPEGVESLVYSAQTANPTDAVTVGMFGVTPGSATEPDVSSGEQLAEPGDLLTSDLAPFGIGDQVTLAGREFTVVGSMGEQSTNGGMPTVVISLPDAQEVLFQGLPLVTAGVVPAGVEVDRLDDTFRVQPAEEARADALRVLASARQSIDFVKGLLWLVAALIVGSVTYLSVIERLRDFAVFKAIGTSTGHIAGGVVLQAVVLSTVSALIGVALGAAIAPTFPMPVVISARSMALLPALGLVVGSVASLFGLSRILKVEPAIAFGGAA
jgi:putative ABC transport system permease protein